MSAAQVSHKQNFPCGGGGVDITLSFPKKKLFKKKIALVILQSNKTFYVVLLAFIISQFQMLNSK